MENRDLIPSKLQRPSGSTNRDSLIREWVLRFQVNAGQNLTPEHANSVVALWTDSFSDLTDSVLEAAFQKTIKSCKFWPKVADVREHLDRANSNHAEEQAALAWQKVRNYIRLDYHPDLSSCRPRFSERVRRAINAAGGLADLSECSGENLVFARKRFIESYLRWDELKQDEYLLPDSDVKELPGGAAEKLNVVRLTTGEKRQ